MGRDKQPKDRQLARRTHKETRRASYARILIVTEGSKTEPLYFNDIRAAYRLHLANIAVCSSQVGTAPIQVVTYAHQLFEKGDLRQGIRPKSFDQVYAVFDRDDHDSYFTALDKAKSLNGKLKNDDKQQVAFNAIASIPCFELWLLLHYENIQAPIHRDEVIQRLKQSIPNYEKSMDGVFATTKDLLTVATQRAQALANQFSAYSAPEPYTAIVDLLTLLINLHDSRC